jgi:hypothetical protein
MGRPKNPDTKTREEAIRQKLASQDALRQELRKKRESKARRGLKNESQQREEFRVFWARAKKEYGRGKEIEDILWTHLKAIQMTAAHQFEAGLAHFGLRKKV